MNETFIQQIGKKHFEKIPLEIIRKTIGICNEVYELRYKSDSYILRMNQESGSLYGTHKFLPLFKKLEINTPVIIAEDYSKTEFPFCYQIQNKLEGQDFGLVLDTLSKADLTQIAKEVSNIFDKFNTLDTKVLESFLDLNEFKHTNVLQNFEDRRTSIIARDEKTHVVGKDIIEIHDQLLERYKDYFLQKKPKVYYDDISYKNVMIHNGKFNGLVDLDFLAKGDYLEAIGAMLSCWYENELGEFYISEIIRFQQLDELGQKIIKLYAILNLILWLSESGVRFNSNSTSEINWEQIEEKRARIIRLYHSMEE